VNDQKVFQNVGTRRPRGYGMFSIKKLKVLQVCSFLVFWHLEHFCTFLYISA